MIEGAYRNGGKAPFVSVSNKTVDLLIILEYLIWPCLAVFPKILAAFATSLENEGIIKREK